MTDSRGFLTLNDDCTNNFRLLLIKILKLQTVSFVSSAHYASPPQLPPSPAPAPASEALDVSQIAQIIGVLCRIAGLVLTFGGHAFSFRRDAWFRWRHQTCRVTRPAQWMSGTEWLTSSRLCITHVSDIRLRLPQLSRVSLERRMNWRGVNVREKC